MIDRQRFGLVSSLGITQTLAWASSCRRSLPTGWRATQGFRRPGSSRHSRSRCRYRGCLGRVSVAPSISWRDNGSGRCRRSLDRPGAGCRAGTRSRILQSLSPTPVGKDFDAHASHRSDAAADRRRRFVFNRIHAAPWCRQWHSDECAWNSSARGVWVGTADQINSYIAGLILLATEVEQPFF